VLVTRGDLDGAMRLYQQSLEIKERLGDLNAWAYTCAGKRGRHAARNRNAWPRACWSPACDLDGAMRLYQQSLELEERLGDLKGKSATLHAMANVLVTRGDLDGAMRLYQQSLELDERLGNLQGKAITLGTMGQALWAQGKHGEAIASLWSGLKLLRQLKIEPQTQQAMASVLADWREQMGAEAFDRLWQQVTGERGPSTNRGTNQRMWTADRRPRTADGEMGGGRWYDWLLRPAEDDRQRIRERINECGRRTTGGTARLSSPSGEKKLRAFVT
jgi:tetratricopeptide (TPR) repeat protein